MLHSLNIDPLSADPTLTTVGGRGATKKRSQPLYGQTGVVLLVDDALSAGDVKRLCDLGPNLTPKQNSDTEIVTGQRANLLMIDKRVAARFKFLFSPKVL